VELYVSRISIFDEVIIHIAPLTDEFSHLMFAPKGKYLMSGIFGRYVLRAVILTLLSGFLQGCAVNTDPKPEANTNWPVTCYDAIEVLMQELPQSEKDNLAAMAEADLILLHHGFGTTIRNEFGLWNGNYALIKDCGGSKAAHPDRVSMTIIKQLWEKLNKHQ